MDERDKPFIRSLRNVAALHLILCFLLLREKIKSTVGKYPGFGEEGNNEYSAPFDKTVLRLS